MNTTRRCSGYNITNTLQRIVPNIVKFQSEETPFTLIEDSQRLRHPRDELGADILRLVHCCLVYTYDAADDLHCVDLGGVPVLIQKQ